MPVSPLTDPRSEATRQRLIDTGLELFGRYGFDGVTTRQLAEPRRLTRPLFRIILAGKKGFILLLRNKSQLMLVHRSVTCRNRQNRDSVLNRRSRCYWI